MLSNTVTQKINPLIEGNPLFILFFVKNKIIACLLKDFFKISLNLILKSNNTFCHK